MGEVKIGMGMGVAFWAKRGQMEGTNGKTGGNVLSVETEI